MTIETELESLVISYTKSERGFSSTQKDLSDEERSRLAEALNQVFYNWLLKSGVEKESIKANYELLIYYFNRLITQKNPNFMWLNTQLYSSSMGDDIPCLIALSNCYQKLTAPEHFKELEFHNINTPQDLKKWLEIQIEKSRTASERSLYKKLLGLLDETTSYYDEIGIIKPNGIKILLASLPIIFVSIGTVVFVEELFALYAFYFVLLKAGQYIAGSNLPSLNTLGKILQEVSTVTATATTTILAGIVELMVMVTHQCYATTIKISTTIFDPLFLSNPSSSEVLESSMKQDLLAASKNAQKGLLFRHLELKIIAAPLEVRYGLLREQYFIGWRAGKQKKDALRDILITIQALDKDPSSLEEKFTTIQSLLNHTKKDSIVYAKGSQTVLAIDKSEQFLRFLTHNFLPISEEKVDINTIEPGFRH